MTFFYDEKEKGSQIRNLYGIYIILAATHFYTIQESCGGAWLQRIQILPHPYCCTTSQSESGKSLQKLFQNRTSFFSSSCATALFQKVENQFTMYSSTEAVTERYLGKAKT